MFFPVFLPKGRRQVSAFLCRIYLRAIITFPLLKPNLLHSALRAMIVPSLLLNTAMGLLYK
jgi:hypothetical protein